MKTLAGTPLPDEAAERLAAEAMRTLSEVGVRVRRGWDRRAPFAVDVGSGSYFTPHGHALDHVYRLVDPAGRVTYVSEPYELHPQDVDRFAQLDGWNVVIDGCALWYPGRTVRVRFHRREGAER